MTPMSILITTVPSSGKVIIICRGDWVRIGREQQALLQVCEWGRIFLNEKIEKIRVNKALSRICSLK